MLEPESYPRTTASNSEFDCEFGVAEGKENPIKEKSFVY